MQLEDEIKELKSKISKLQKDLEHKESELKSYYSSDAIRTTLVFNGEKSEYNNIKYFDISGIKLYLKAIDIDLLKNKIKLIKNKSIEESHIIYKFQEFRGHDDYLHIRPLKDNNYELVYGVGTEGAGYDKKYLVSSDNLVNVLQKVVDNHNKNKDIFVLYTMDFGTGLHSIREIINRLKLNSFKDCHLYYNYHIDRTLYIKKIDSQNYKLEYKEGKTTYEYNYKVKELIEELENACKTFYETNHYQ